MDTPRALSAAKHRLVLIEGIPGAGKTTLAQALCQHLRAQGQTVCWHREEAPDHPVYPQAQRRVPPDANRRQHHLQCWQRFADAADGVTRYILEGSLLQTSARFLLEQRDPAIDPFLRDWQPIVAPLSPVLIHLRPQALPSLQATVAERGPNWAGKVADYLARQPHSQFHGWTGLAGMLEFWCDYQRQCDGWLRQLAMPQVVIDRAEGGWQRQFQLAVDFIDGLDK